MSHREVWKKETNDFAFLTSIIGYIIMKSFGMKRIIVQKMLNY
jgi:hypothetical protein